MPMLAELIDAVVGVDTHRDTHQVDIALPNAAPITLTTVSNDTTGYAHPPAQGQPGPTADHRHDIAPGLLERRRIGPVSAAQAIVSFSHPGRCRNDAAFAALAGANPLPASSGPRSCLALGCRWPRPRGCWLAGYAARRGRHGGMSSGPRAAGCGLRAVGGGSAVVAEATTVFTVRLPATLAARVRQRARESGSTISGLVVQALTEFLARGQRSPRRRCTTGWSRDTVRVRPPRGHGCVGGPRHSRATTAGPPA